MPCLANRDHWSYNKLGDAIDLGLTSEAALDKVVTRGVGALVAGTVAVFQAGRSSAQGQDNTMERGWFSSSTRKPSPGVPPVQASGR